MRNQDLIRGIYGQGDLRGPLRTNEIVIKVMTGAQLNRINISRIVVDLKRCICSEQMVIFINDTHIHIVHLQVVRPRVDFTGHARHEYNNKNG
jgi:hypothetical protein